ncbi:MAG: cupin domain-containing protein [Gammaproteobacteria bacterium]
MSEYHDDAEESTLDPEMLTALLQAITPVAPPPALRAKVLERIHAAHRSEDFLTLTTQVGWCELLPGVEVKRLFVDEQTGTKSFLLRAQGGIHLPAHGHRGREECLVLEGEFTMGDLTLRAGDYHVAPEGSEHPMASTHTGVTVYLRAALADYPGV